MLKLSIELVPETAWYNNLRSLMPKESWNKLRKRILSEATYTCSICSSKERIECHEMWTYDDERHIQKLTSIVALCNLCHAVKHIGRTGNESKERYERVVSHFMTINHCNRMTFETEKIKAFAVWEERSKYQWRLDIGDVEGVNFFV